VVVLVPRTPRPKSSHPPQRTGVWAGWRLVPSELRRELRAAGKAGTDGILANDAFREDSSLTRMVLPEPRSRGGTGKKCRREVAYLSLRFGGVGEEV
jgi:hypothetical protein